MTRTLVSVEAEQPDEDAESPSRRYERRNDRGDKAIRKHDLATWILALVGTPPQSVPPAADPVVPPQPLPADDEEHDDDRENGDDDEREGRRDKGK